MSKTNETTEQETTSVSLLDYLNALEDVARKCFATKDEAHVLQVRATIEFLADKVTEIRKTWDSQYDMRSMFGADTFSAKVTRIRKETEKKGKTEVSNPLASFTL
jgi:uncharacterized protein (UPF0305 family)